MKDSSVPNMREQNDGSESAWRATKTKAELVSKNLHAAALREIGERGKQKTLLENIILILLVEFWEKKVNRVNIAFKASIFPSK